MTMKRISELTNEELISRLVSGSRYYGHQELAREIIKRFRLYVDHGDLSRIDDRKSIEGGWMENREERGPCL